jgi:hypothetical protein
MLGVLSALVAALLSALKTRAAIQLENLVLRRRMRKRGPTFQGLGCRPGQRWLPRRPRDYPPDARGIVDVRASIPRSSSLQLRTTFVWPSGRGTGPASHLRAQALREALANCASR